MDDILAGILHMFIYLDDILVVSPTMANYKKDLHRVMEKLRLVIKEEKCWLFKPQVEFLGHLVDKSGIRPLPA